MQSLVPAAETRLSVMTLKHRMVWNSHKIRIILMASFRQEDAPLLLGLLHLFYDTHYDADALMKLKTRKDVLDYYNKD